MNCKNRLSGLSYLTVLLLLSTLLIGCGSSKDSFIEKEINPQINVYGVKLNMPESKVHEAIASKGERAMCVYGYEYEYAEKQINIGFNSKTELVRRVTTKNPETSIYGINPGIELAKANEIIAANGFTKDEKSKYKYYKENIILSIISMKGSNADGIVIEIQPD